MPISESGYAALWRLPRPDSHRLTNTDFKTHHSRYWPARSPSRDATLYIESSDSFVASTAASIASTRWSEPVPGPELHPLKSSAFSRRTVTPAVGSFLLKTRLEPFTEAKS